MSNRKSIQFKRLLQKHDELTERYRNDIELNCGAGSPILRKKVMRLRNALSIKGRP